MEIQLKAKRVLKIVNGTSPQPDKETRPTDYEEWDHDDTNALMWIRSNCEKNQVQHLRINFLLKRFHNYRPGSNDTVDDIAAALESLRLGIADIKAEYAPPGPVMAITLMCTIEGPAYETTKHLLEREPELTLEAAKEALKSIKERLKQDDAIEDAHRASAKRKGPSRKCDSCKKTGHTTNYCWDWLDNTDEGQEWEGTHPDQKRKSPKNSIPNSSRNAKPTSTNTASSSKSRGISKGTARVVDESDNEKNEDAGWMAVDEMEEEILESLEETNKPANDWMLSPRTYP